jgi:hypothetical protein
MDASLPIRIKAFFYAKKTPSTKKFKVTPSGGKFNAYRVLGFSGSTVSPFSEAW